MTKSLSNSILKYMEKIIEISNLCKSFGEIRAVDDLSFSVAKGELFAFLGVNGAGKSTTISILCGTLAKDGGTVVIDGKNIDVSMREISKEIGVVFQYSVLDGCLTVKDNLYFRAALYGMIGKEADERISELAEKLDFIDLMGRTVNKLSGGQRRRIDVARALLCRPKILILDEPTTGLDPQTRKTLWGVIDDFRKNENMTVFLTTHYMEEVTDADYVVIIDGGKIVAEGSPLQLKNTYVSDYVTVYGMSEDDAKSLGFPYEKLNGAIRLCVKDTEQARDLIIGNPRMFTDFEITKGKMDDVFLAATGKSLSGGETK